MKCPFISNDVMLTECLGSDCQVWDIDNEQCGALVSNTIKKPTDDYNHILGMLEAIIGARADLLGTDHTLLKVLKHTHDSHQHPRQHSGNALPVEIGDSINGGMGKMRATALIQEHLHNEDLDNNGLIWMVDFIFDNTDPNIPPMIKNVSSGIDTSALGIETIFTWNQYLNTLI